MTEGHFQEGGMSSTSIRLTTMPSAADMIHALSAPDDRSKQRVRSSLLLSLRLSK